MSQVSLGSESSVLLAGGGHSSQFSMLVDGVADPVELGVVADRSVLWVHEDDLEVLVGGVLVDPVRVQDSQAAALSSHLLLGSGLSVPLWFQGSDTLVNRLSVHDTLGDWLLSSSSSDSRPVDDDSLLGLVSQTPGLVWPGWASQAADGWQLPVLPAPNTKQETQHVALLLSPQLLDVLE